MKGTYAWVAVAALALLAFFDAWTIFVPTALLAALLLFSYSIRNETQGKRGALAAKSISWWVMTWFITVAVCLTVVGTFLRGPGWSWIWPWSAHAS